MLIFKVESKDGTKYFFSYDEVNDYMKSLREAGIQNFRKSEAEVKVDIENLNWKNTVKYAEES